MVDGLVAVELTVGAVVDERRTAAGLAAVDVSVVGGVNDSVWPYWKCAWTTPVSLQCRSLRKLLRQHHTLTRAS